MYPARKTLHHVQRAQPLASRKCMHDPVCMSIKFNCRICPYVDGFSFGVFHVIRTSGYTIQLIKLIKCTKPGYYMSLFACYSANTHTALKLTLKHTIAQYHSQTQSTALRNFITERAERIVAISASMGKRCK